MDAKVKKEAAIQHLTTLIEELEAIPVWDSFSYSRPATSSWEEEARLAIELMFGKSSSQDQAFREITKKSFPGSLVEGRLFLKSRIREIRLYWVDDNVNQSTTPQSISQSTDSSKTAINSSNPDILRRVWVVHGRDERLRTGLFSFLRSIGLEPLEFGQARALTKKPMPCVGEILEVAFEHAQAVLVLLTPDDQARLRADLVRDSDPAYEKDLTGQARPNVLFEAGMALISHRDQTILVQFGNVRPFSDVAGRHLIHMDNSVAKRQELAQRLSAAKCSVNLSGTDWHTEGDLNPPK